MMWLLTAVCRDANSIHLYSFREVLSTADGRHAPPATRAHTIRMMGGIQPPPSIPALGNRPWLVASLLGLMTFLVFSPAVF